MAKRWIWPLSACNDATRSSRAATTAQGGWHLASCGLIGLPTNDEEGNLLILVGGPCWIRTSDQRIKSPLLYQLS
jgi:hypothetical protein